MIQFVFFGRLVKEKWIDIIIDVVQKMIDDENNNKSKQLSQIQFFICGDWPYKQQILELAEKTSNLHFFWWCNQAQLVQKIASSHYTLMPSTFLETFWLSALESLSLWVPVVWFGKWWLTNFIPSHLDITKQEWENDSDKLYNLINFLTTTHSESKVMKNTQQSLDIAKHYFPNNWIQNFNVITKRETIHNSTSQEIASSWKISRNDEKKDKQTIKKILLISDYKTIYGWIETYLYKTQENLIKNGYQCKIWGANFGKWFIGNMLRKIGFFWSFFNICAGIRLSFYIKKNKPDLLRWNSCLRMLGRFPLRMQRKFEGKQRMMHHDLWYFHPFPSQVEQIEQIPTTWSVSSFCKNTIWWKKPFVAWKFLLLKLLREQLKRNINLHLVPSSFIKPFVQNLYNIEDKKIKVFPHCLDEFFVWVSDGMKKAQKSTSDKEKNKKNSSSKPNARKTT